jgi:hypothetical protein
MAAAGTRSRSHIEDSPNNDGVGDLSFDIVRGEVSLQPFDFAGTVGKAAAALGSLAERGPDLAEVHLDRVEVQALGRDIARAGTCLGQLRPG